MAYTSSSKSPSSHYGVQPSASLAYRPRKQHNSSSRSEFYTRRKPLSLIDYGPPPPLTPASSTTTSAWHYTAPVRGAEEAADAEQQQQHTLLAQWCSLHNWRAETAVGTNNSSLCCRPLTAPSQCGIITASRLPSSATQVSYLAPVYAAATAFCAAADDDDEYGSSYKNGNRVQFETWSGRTRENARVPYGFSEQQQTGDSSNQRPYYASPQSQNYAEPKLPKKLLVHSKQKQNFRVEPKFEPQDDPLYISQHEDGDKSYSNARQHTYHTDIGPPRKSAKPHSSSNTIYRSHSSRNDIKPPTALLQRRTTASSVIGTSSSSNKNQPVLDDGVYAVPSFYHRFRPSTRSDDGIKQLLPTRLAETNATTASAKNNSSTVRKSNSIKRWQRISSLSNPKNPSSSSSATTAQGSTRSGTAALPPRDNSQTRRSSNTQHTATTHVCKDSSVTPPGSNSNGVGTMVSSLRLRLLGGSSSKSSTTAALKSGTFSKSDNSQPKGDPSSASVSSQSDGAPENQLHRRQNVGYQTPNSILYTPNSNDDDGEKGNQAVPSHSPSLSNERQNGHNSASYGGNQLTCENEINHLTNTARLESQQNQQISTAFRPQSTTNTAHHTRSSTVRSNINGSKSSSYGYELEEDRDSTDTTKSSYQKSSAEPRIKAVNNKASRSARCSSTSEEQQHEQCSSSSSKNNNGNASSSRTDAEDIIIMRAQPQRNSIPSATTTAVSAKLTKTLLASDEQTSSTTTTRRCEHTASYGRTATTAATEAARIQTNATSTQVCAFVPATVTPAKCSKCSANNSVRNKNHNNNGDGTHVVEAASARDNNNFVRQQSIPARTPTPSPHMVLLAETAKRRNAVYGAATTDDTPAVISATSGNAKKHFLTLRVKSTAASFQQHHNDRRRIEVGRSDTPTPPSLVVPPSLLNSSTQRHVTASPAKISTTFENKKRFESDNSTLGRDSTSPISRQPQLEPSRHNDDDSRSILASPISSVADEETSPSCFDSDSGRNNGTIRRHRKASANQPDSSLSNSRPTSTSSRNIYSHPDINSDLNFDFKSNHNSASSTKQAYLNGHEFLHNREADDETPHDSTMKSLKHMLRLNSSNAHNDGNSSSGHYSRTSRSNSVIVNSTIDKSPLHQVPVLFSTDYYTPIVVTPYNSASNSPPSANSYSGQNQNLSADYNIYSAATSLSSASDNVSSHYNSSIAAHSQNPSSDGFSTANYATPSQQKAMHTANGAASNQTASHARSASGVQPNIAISTVTEPAAAVLPPPPPPLSPSVIRRQKVTPPPQQPTSNNLVNVSRRASEHLNLSQLNKLNTVVAATAARRRRESLIDAGSEQFAPLAPDCNQYQRSGQSEAENLISRPVSVGQQQRELTAPQLPAKLRGSLNCELKIPDGYNAMDTTVSEESTEKPVNNGNELSNAVSGMNFIPFEQHTSERAVDVDGVPDGRPENFNNVAFIAGEERCTDNGGDLWVSQKTMGGSTCIPPPPPPRAPSQNGKEITAVAPVLPNKRNTTGNPMLFTRQHPLRRACPLTQQHQQANLCKEQPFIMIRKPRLRTVSTDRSDARFQRLSVCPSSEYASPASCKINQKLVDPAIVSSSPIIKTTVKHALPGATALEEGLHRRPSLQPESAVDTSSRSGAIHITVPAGVHSSSTATTNSDSSEFGGGNSFEADSNGCENTLLAPSRIYDHMIVHPSSLPQLPSLSMPSRSPSSPSYFGYASLISKDGDAVDDQSCFTSPDPKSGCMQNSGNSYAVGAVDFDCSIRGQLVNEIIQNERDYVKNLRDIVEGYLYKCRERSDMFSKGRIELIFGNVEQIYEFQSELLTALEQSLTEQVCKKKSLNNARRLSSISSPACDHRVSDSEKCSLNYRSNTEANPETSPASEQQPVAADTDCNGLDKDDSVTPNDNTVDDTPSSPPSNECLRDAEIGHWFLMHQQGFAELYTEYCINHAQACAELRQLLQITQYRYFFEACRRLREMIDIPLSGFLLQPVQKICKYPLQLHELLKSTPHSHADHESVKLALQVMTQTTMLVNERKRRLECLEKIALFQHTIQQWEGEDLLERSSTLLHHGELQRVGDGQTSNWNKDYHFFLFDHQLLYCKRDMLKRSLLYKSRLDLNECQVESLQPQNELCVKHGFRIWCQSKSRWFVFGAKTAEDRAKWLKAFGDERRMVSDDQFHKFHIQPRHRLSAIEQTQKILLSNRGRKITYRDALKDLEEHRASTLTPAKRSRSLSFPSRLKSAGDLSELAKNNSNVGNWAALMDQPTDQLQPQRLDHY